jgi:hypothetical protein
MLLNEELSKALIFSLNLIAKSNIKIKKNRQFPRKTIK